MLSNLYTNLLKATTRPFVSSEKLSRNISSPFIRHFQSSSFLSNQHLAGQIHGKETIQAVNALREQLRYYAIAEIAGRPFLVTKNDVVVVDHMKEVQLGDVLKLNRIRELGSKDYTIQGKPYVSQDFYSIRATVIEQPKGKQIEIIKKKRRKGYQRRLTHRQPYTVLRISEVEVNKLA
ncbi:hypothetical protein K493DRAFT_315326 [Basidiobolus meristosporus CBS 931.73]|uniref:Large ribosomal subunit protein bL21m n=1 Tax=Basidiobolus meristosporus CBS 931.73 TaxID=1314790 RepID=A0A1Y1Y9V6_9FUNG|nr:hypothetical protein K493DRAFT_315326 [Basidiobolus meristosporus CBS 931.73]|eukprot:ORX94809.1 hypothetical protein K493DRAFT_315326 [Basidiobolus meristosporus CBS 931.73]